MQRQKETETLTVTLDSLLEGVETRKPAEPTKAEPVATPLLDMVAEEHERPRLVWPDNGFTADDWIAYDKALDSIRLVKMLDVVKFLTSEGPDDPERICTHCGRTNCVGASHA